MPEPCSGPLPQPPGEVGSSQAPLHYTTCTSRCQEMHCGGPAAPLHSRLVGDAEMVESGPLALREIEQEAAWNAPQLEQLARAYGAGQLCLFLGAGVSKGCGLPVWAEL